MTALQTPFNTAQLELLQLFEGGINDTETAELKKILLDFKFKRVSDLADKIIDANNWSAEEIAKKAMNMKRSKKNIKH